jgi:hypothetical protein
MLTDLGSTLAVHQVRYCIHICVHLIHLVLLVSTAPVEVTRRAKDGQEGKIIINLKVLWI